MGQGVLEIREAFFEVFSRNGLHFLLNLVFHEGKRGIRLERIPFFLFMERLRVLALHDQFFFFE